jgi:hypothetical protein
MESYQTWFGEGPELSILRMLGLFDRPADEKAIRALLEPPAIPSLTESLAGLSPSEWRTMLSRLRRAKLLAGKDPHNPGEVDAHPLVREYFGEQLRNQRAAAWKESNRRLFAHYQRLAPHLPESFGEMEPLFLAVVCGCNAGLFRAALHEVYLPRIQRGSASFAANVLSARGALLSVLAHFFEDGYLGSTFETSIDGQSLTAEDQLFILMQAAQYLPATRGLGSPELRICYERAESLCQSLHHPRLLCLAVRGLWRYSIITAKPIVALPIAERVYSLAQRQDDPMLVIGALDSLASTLFHLCDFESSRKYAMRGVQIWRLGGVQFHPEDFDTPVVGCLCYEAMSEWHLGEISACQATMDQAISLATELNDANALVFALQFAAVLAHLERNRAETERLALEMIELSTRYNLVIYLHVGAILRGWVRCASGNPVEGISWIERGIREYRASGSIVGLSYFLVVKAEALHLADRTSEALEAIVEAEATVERSGVRTSRPELHRLRGVFLAAMGADEAQIEASFRESIRIAREQKAISIEKRAKANFAEYCRQKTSVPEGRGFRLPVW